MEGVLGLFDGPFPSDLGLSVMPTTGLWQFYSKPKGYEAFGSACCWVPDRVYYIVSDHEASNIFFKSSGYTTIIAPPLSAGITDNLPKGLLLL